MAANDEPQSVIRDDIHRLLDTLRQRIDAFSVSQLGVRLCPLQQRVAVYSDSRPPIPGKVVGYAFHELPGAGERMGISCVIRLEVPFDSPHGFYVRYLVVPHGGFEPVE